MKVKQSGMILFTENYEEAVDFYALRLGLSIQEQLADLTVFAFGGSYLMVERGGIAAAAAKTRAQNPTVLRLDVSDFEQTVRELRERNVNVEIQVHTWGTIGVIIDPEGNRIELKDAAL